jgi:class 3 adenylate cyclase
VVPRTDFYASAKQGGLMEIVRPGGASSRDVAGSYRELALRCREMAKHCRRPGALLLRAATFDQAADTLEPRRLRLPEELLS